MDANSPRTALRQLEQGNIAASNCLSGRRAPSNHFKIFRPIFRLQFGRIQKETKDRTGASTNELLG